MGTGTGSQKIPTGYQCQSLDAHLEEGMMSCILMQLNNSDMDYITL